MGVTRSVWPAACAAACLLAATAARATNVNFNFEASDQGWTVETLGSVEKPWTYLETGPDKGWQAFRGADAAGSGSYLVSPILYIDPPASPNAQYVGVRIKHFYDFGAVDDPWSLGQVQYRYAGGSWQGIRTADFEPAAAEHYPPNYADPPVPFIAITNVPVANTPVEAWAGATAGFPGTHRDSNFDLEFPPLGAYPFVPGQTIQFRLLAGTLDPLAEGSPQLLWDVTAVEIFHVSLVPEPGTVTLAAVGLVAAGVGFVRGPRRRAGIGA